MKRALTLGLVLLATAANATELATATRNTRESPGQKTQWAPSGNFSALHARAVFRGDSRSSALLCACERRETAARQRIWSYANLSPARYTDPDGRDIGFQKCLALEKSGKGDVATCMRGMIDPNRKRYFRPDEPQQTTGVRAFGEGVLERAGSFVMVPSELAINSIGFDPDFNPISTEKQQQAKATVDEMQAGIRNRVWFPPLLVKDAFVGGGTALGEFGSAAVDGDARALGGASLEVAIQVPALFEGGIGAARLLTPAKSLLAQPAKSVLNPSNWSVKFQVVLAAGPVPPIIVPRFKYTGLLRVRRAGTFIADLSVQPTLTLEQRAAQLQARAAELQNLRSGFTPEMGTTAVIEAEHVATGNRRVFIGTNESRLSIPPEWANALEPWETFVSGNGHAEPSVLNGLSDEWRPIVGGSSRNICWLSCAWELGEHGLGLGGTLFPGVDKSGHRMFWVDIPPP
jgi:hypothetical protein